MQTVPLNWLRRSGLPHAVVVLAFLSGTAVASAQTRSAADEGPVEMSAFTVKGDQDQGYKVSNAITATRVGAAIVDTPLNIHVVTGQQLEDLNVRRMGEAVNYVAGAIGDKIFPDDGLIRMRGQPIGAPFRNGFRRNLSITADNVERIEVVKGPASVFFGEGNPGGIINYITKKPRFKNALSLDYTFGSYEYSKAKLDAEARLGADVGLRVFGSWEDSNNWMDYSFNQVDFIAPTLKWRAGPQFEILIGVERRRQEMNDGFMNLTSNRQFHVDYDNPPADIQAATRMTAAQLRTRWNFTPANWATDVAAARGVRPFVITENVDDFSPRGNRLNAVGPEYFQQRNVDTADLEATSRAASWVDLRYALNWTNQKYNLYDVAPLTVNGDRTVRLDGIRGNPTHSKILGQQLDLVFRHETAWLKSKLLTGGEINRDENTTRVRVYDYNRLTPTRDRNGNTLSGINIYRFWDPFLHAPIQIGEADAGVSANYTTSDAKRRAYYATHQGEWWRGRVHTMAGVRRTRFTNQAGNQAGPTGTQRVSKVVPMGGFTLRLRDGFTFFASYSENFIPTVQLAAGGLGARAEEMTQLPPEQGTGWDVGMKTDWKQGLLSGSITVFQLDRQNIAKADITRRSNDPRNLDTNPNNDVTFFTASGLERSQGTELNLVVSPTTRAQFIVGYSYLWEAKLVRDPSLAPGSNDYNVLIGRRLRSAPLHTFSVLGKYAFTESVLKGVVVGSGVRYVGQHEALSQNATFNLSNDSSTVVEIFASYEMRLASHKLRFHLSSDNVFDEQYVIGNRHYGDPRKVFLSVKFDY